MSTRLLKQNLLSEYKNMVNAMLFRQMYFLKAPSFLVFIITRTFELLGAPARTKSTLGIYTYGEFDDAMPITRAGALFITYLLEMEDAHIIKKLINNNVSSR